LPPNPPPENNKVYRTRDGRYSYCNLRATFLPIADLIVKAIKSSIMKGDKDEGELV